MTGKYLVNHAGVCWYCQGELDVYRNPGWCQHALTVSSFSKIASPACTLFQCSRSCGLGIQKRELRCGERDSQGGYVPSTAHQDIPQHFNRSAQTLKSPLCHLCAILWVRISVFFFGKMSFWKAVFEPTACPLPLHRYAEFPIRRCRNTVKPLVDLQQGCNRGPCPELPRVFPGRTTASAVVLGWYSSPWQQVHLLALWSKTAYTRQF